MQEYSSLAELHRKTVASAVWAGEVEAEWREGDMSFRFKCTEDRERFMSEVDRHRAVDAYGQSMETGSSATLYVCGRHQCWSLALRVD